MRSPGLDELPPPPAGRVGWPWTKGSRRVERAAPGGRAWPRLSVVTPSFRQGKYIEETIRSVLLQGYPEIEYFIFDGGSDDETVEIIKKYEPWLAGWASEKDRGQAHAINKGLDRFTGEIGAYLNSDDVYQPNAFAHVGAAYRAPGFDVFVGRRKSPRPSMHLLRRSWWRARMKPLCVPYIMAGHKYGYALPQECVFWSREKFGALRYEEDFHYCMDVQFFARIFPGSRALVSTREVGFARAHAETKSATLIDVGKEEGKRIDAELAGFAPRLSEAAAEGILAAHREANRRAGLKWLLAPWSDTIFSYELPNYRAEGNGANGPA